MPLTVKEIQDLSNKLEDKLQSFIKLKKETDMSDLESVKKLQKLHGETKKLFDVAKKALDDQQKEQNTLPSIIKPMAALKFVINTWDSEYAKEIEIETPKVKRGLVGSAVAAITDFPQNTRVAAAHYVALREVRNGVTPTVSDGFRQLIDQEKKKITPEEKVKEIDQAYVHMVQTLNAQNANKENLEQSDSKLIAFIAKTAASEALESTKNAAANAATSAKNQLSKGSQALKGIFGVKTPEHGSQGQQLAKAPSASSSERSSTDSDTSNQSTSGLTYTQMNNNAMVAIGSLSSGNSKMNTKLEELLRAGNALANAEVANKRGVASGREPEKKLEIKVTHEQFERMYSDFMNDIKKAKDEDKKGTTKRKF